MSKTTSFIPDTNDPDVATTRTISSNRSAAEKCKKVTPETMASGFESWMEKMDRLLLREQDRSIEEKELFAFLNNLYSENKNRFKTTLACRILS